MPNHTSFDTIVLDRERTSVRPQGITAPAQPAPTAKRMTPEERRQKFVEVQALVMHEYKALFTELAR